ncbi:MAG: DUF2760 domain-containing protein [Deltaproteobacteria bacterium]|jgi:hypothetical protein|nr:DUF2760 domain-containing protein [Deltaproteobacteria bacterium]
MDIIKAYSFRSFVIIMFFMAFMCLLVDSTFYVILTNAEVVLSGHKNLIDLVVMMEEKFRLYYVPMSAGVFGLIGILLWVCMRFLFVNLLKTSDKATVDKKDDTKVKGSLDNKKEKKNNDRRLFLHLLSVFQREGRLMDFFSEDLNHYEDSQIGAAVRSIHESCKKVVDKAISPESVIDEKEGDEITIQQDFNPSAIKLTGNVTGEPPFKGIVRHRGWKAKRLEMPTLSGSQEPGIIAPAEVEIV